MNVSVIPYLAFNGNCKEAVDRYIRVFGGQDVYIIGQDNPLETFDGIVIAVYHRTNDVEDKWIVAEEGTDFSDEEIMKNIHFVEQFFEGYLCR